MERLNLDLIIMHSRGIKFRHGKRRQMISAMAYRYNVEHQSWTSVERWAEEHISEYADILQPPANRYNNWFDAMTRLSRDAWEHTLDSAIISNAP